MKRNEKLTIALGVISLLALSVLCSPSLNLVKAQAQNQSSPQIGQEAQQKLYELAQKFRGLIINSGVNLSLPQGGNLSEKLQELMDSPQFKNLSQEVSQQLLQLGVNESSIQTMKQEAGSDLSTLAQKLQNLTASRGGQ
jgi:hypothetical protein